MERVNYVAAKQKADNIVDIAQRVSNGFKDIASEMDAKLGNQSVWSGGAANDFKAKWNEFTNVFNIQLEQIMTVRDKIEFTRVEMARAEQAMESSTNSTMSSL